jgi:hypothetical protein
MSDCRIQRLVSESVSTSREVYGSEFIPLRATVKILSFCVQVNLGDKSNYE